MGWFGRNWAWFGGNLSRLGRNLGWFGRKLTKFARNWAWFGGNWTWFGGTVGDPIGVNVNWVHTKFMLVDPLGSNPTTLTGSANWSLASADTNDENLVVIRGDTRVADIYFGEFMRIFAHHRFRESVKRHIAQHGSTAFSTWKPQDLFEDWRQWVPSHFRAGSEKDIKRCYFAG